MGLGFRVAGLGLRVCGIRVELGFQVRGITVWWLWD